MTDTWTRRGLLAGCVGGVAGLAGCNFSVEQGEEEGDDADFDVSGDVNVTGENGSDGGTAANGSDGGANASGDGATDDETGADGTAADETSDGDLDLREANVTAVDVEDAGDGEYRFSVTLYHDDSGEDGYADWWQVETREGEQLGRRELLHAHSTEPFTRSETIAVPDDVDCVVVRGHDQTHDYGGQAMVVSVPDGASEARRQGSEPEDFGDADCP